MGGKVLELESERLIALGEERGATRGEERLSVLISKLIQDNRNAEIQSAVTDPAARKQLYKEYGI